MAATRMKLRVRQRNVAAGSAEGAPLEGDADGTREGGRSRRRRRGNKASASAEPAPSSSSVSPPNPSSVGARPAVAAEASPDSKCPICLDRFNNLAYLDHCLHRFCFPCIQEWSHNKAECPLCKQPFASILHSVRAEDDFKEYTLQPPPRAGNQLTASTFLTTVAAVTSDGGTQHHLRLMLRRQLVAADREAVRRRRRRAASLRSSDDRMGQWELFMRSPPLPVSPYHLDMSELIMDNMRVREVAEEMMRRDEERRRIFDNATGVTGAAAAAQAGPSARASRRLMCRLAVRRRLQREGGVIQMRERELIAFRKALYQCGVRVQGISGNQGRRRAVTAESFRRRDGPLNRLHAWLRRELLMLLGSDSSLADAVQRTITARVLRSGLEDIAAVEEELRPFLLTRTEHFVHELVSFARSTLSMESYDRQAVYEPAAAMEPDQLGSSSDDSSVIAISEGEEGGASDAAAGGGHEDVIRTGSSLSLAPWDDETPGPSYTTAEPPALSPDTQQPSNQEAGEAGGGEEEECLIVGYKKPIAERTPELVKLSSDSEEDEVKKEEEATAAVEKLTAPTSCCLPSIPPSTSGAFMAEPEAGQRERRQRSHSWSESSGRSRKSVCSLSPATPERRWRDGPRHGVEVEKRRKQPGRDRSGERLRRSGTFCNPNRSIFPPMMSRCSQSPLHSSADSVSSPPLTPRNPSWELRLAQVSPFTSSASSSTSRSFSPLCSSPPETPPTPAYSPKLPYHVEKPGGKRKYKSRHLNGNKDPSWRPIRGRQHEKECRRRGREAERRESSSLKTGHRRSRDERSPSVEIIYEGTVDSGASQPSARKRRRRRHRLAQITSSPIIITLDSDSSRDDACKRTNSGSSSPLSSQQTIDFSDIPSLPLVHSAGVGGAEDREVGELPADILDRGSDASEEAAGWPGAPGRSDNSYVDVENTGDTVSPLETSDDVQPMEPITAADVKAHEAATVGERDGSDKTDPKAYPPDRYLLESILDDLNWIAPPRQNPSQDTDSGFPLEDGKRTGSSHTPTVHSHQNQEYKSSIPSPSPLERTESREAPPLLRRASPVGSYGRNTPPPLRHKDGRSPQQCVGVPRDILPQRSSDLDPIGSTSSMLLGLNKLAIPPIATLKNHLNNVLTASGHRHTAGSRSPVPDRYLSLSFGYFPNARSHPSRECLKHSLPADLIPVNSSHSTDLCPSHHSSTSTGDVKQPETPVRWDSFSGVNSNGAAAFLSDKLVSRECSKAPPGGVLNEVSDSTGGHIRESVTSLSDSASDHMALPPPSFQHSFTFIPSTTKCSSRPESNSVPIGCPESDSGAQNHSDQRSNPQPFSGSQAPPFHPALSVPEPQNQQHPDSIRVHRRLLDSSHQLSSDSYHHLSSEPSHQLISDFSHRPSSKSDHRLASDSSHQLSSDSSHQPMCSPFQFPSDSALQLSLDSSHQLQSDPSHQLSTDPSHQLSTDPSHQLSTDPSHQLPFDPSHQLPFDPSHQLPFDSSHQLPFDSAHPKTSSRIFQRNADNHLFSPQSEQSS